MYTPTPFRYRPKVHPDLNIRDPEPEPDTITMGSCHIDRVLNRRVFATVQSLQQRRTVTLHETSDILQTTTFIH